MNGRKFRRRCLLAALVISSIVCLEAVSFTRARNALIESKMESLRVQGEIIAALVAGDAAIEVDRKARDPAGAPNVGAIRPERIAPILRRLLPGPDTRARVFAPDGALIVDTAGASSRGRRTHPGDRAPVYREADRAGGADYPEVSGALHGSTTRHLAVENGEQTVSVAVPIQIRKAVQGVLLLSTRAGT